MRTFSACRIGKKFDVLHGLAQLIEHRYSAVQQDAATGGRLDPLSVAVEQRLTDCLFQLCDRPRYRGLTRVEGSRSFSHATLLDDCHEYLQTLQSQASFNAVRQIH